MIFLRSLLFNLCFYIWTAIISIGLCPLLLLPRPIPEGIARIWAKGTMCMLKYICGITHRIEGLENRLQTGVIYACKHQSAWETIAFWIMVGNPVFILKRELVWIPFFGWFLLGTGSIAIDRGGKTKTMRQMITKAKSVTDSGRTVIIFPEGTRARIGEALPYQPGIAALYNQLNIPVVPVALNSGTCWSRKAFVKKPGLISVKFLEPIAPGLHHREFLKKLEEVIETESNRLITNP